MPEQIECSHAQYGGFHDRTLPDDEFKPLSCLHRDKEEMNSQRSGSASPLYERRQVGVGVAAGG